MQIELVIAIISALIGIISAVVAVLALREQRRILKWTTGYGRQVQAESMMLEYPGLLEFHGITADLLRENNVTIEEVIYLTQSFRFGQESFRIDPSEKKELSPYRIQMVSSEKVARIWRNVLHNRLFFRTPFVELIENEINSRHPDLRK